MFSVMSKVCLLCWLCVKSTVKKSFYIIIVLWKKVQQEVRQHWFISSYIAAYLQVLYRVARVPWTGLTVTRGIGSSPQY
jgi:hypothetical protein